MGEWKDTTLSDIAQLNMGQSPAGKYYNSDGKGLPFLQGCAEFGRSYPDSKIFTSETPKIAKKDAILFSVRAPVGKLNTADKDYCIGRGLAGINASERNCTKFIYYYLEFQQSRGYQTQGSTFDAISGGQLSKLKVYIPTNPKEQQKIAQILTKVDEAIQQTERLIAKYQAIRTGLMQDLLTRGIDEAGNVRSEETHVFKDSELGRIPVEWEVERLGKICERIQDGTHFSPQPTRLGDFLYLTSKNIRMGRLDLENVLYITEKEHQDIYRRCSVQEGDVLLTKDGANTGNVALNTLKVPFSLLSSVAFLRGKVKVLNNRYLNFCLASPEMQNKLKEQMSGNAIPRITLTKINSTSIRLPPFIEQERIENKFTALEKEYKLELASLNKLRSLKTALMQDLLTGKKRVDDLLK